MKKLTLVAIILLVVGLAVSVGMPRASAGPGKPPASIVVSPAITDLNAKGQVVIMGSGFDPKQEIILFFQDKDGVLSDLYGSVNPNPVANERGTFATVWTIGDFTKVLNANVYSIIAADKELTPLASAPMGFYDAKKPWAELPPWAQAVVPQPKK